MNKVRQREDRQFYQLILAEKDFLKTKIIDLVKLQACSSYFIHQIIKQS